MEAFHGLPCLLEEGEVLEPIPEHPKRSNSDVIQSLEEWDRNKRACHASLLDAVAIPIPRAQRAFEIFANIERENYWAEKTKDVCVEENRVLKRELSEIRRADTQRAEKIDEKDRRIAWLVKNQQCVEQERDELLKEKADTKSQLDAGETAWLQLQQVLIEKAGIKSELDAAETARRELQQQLDARNSHHEKKIEEMQQTLSSEQNTAHQLGLDKSALKAALTAKEKELQEHKTASTKSTADLKEQLKDLTEVNRDKHNRILNLIQDITRVTKAQKSKEKDFRDIEVAFAEEKTRLCKQLKSAENSLEHIHKLSGLPRKVETQSSSG